MGLINWMAKNPESLKGIGSLLGAGGDIYGGIMAQQNANKMLDLQKQGFNLQKRFALEDDAQRKKDREYYAKLYGRSDGLADLNGSVL